MTGIPDELVEKAARALRDFDDPKMHHEQYEADARVALEAVGLPELLEDNEQLRVSVNRQFGEPLDEVYKTDGITIVMQQIQDLRLEKAALLERVEAAEAWSVEVKREMDSPTFVDIRRHGVTLARGYLEGPRLPQPDRDALAAKVADAGERIAQAIEAEREKAIADEKHWRTALARDYAPTARRIALTDAATIARTALTEDNA